MIKLCVFDVDGTLITKGDRQFSYNTITALKNLQKQGVKLAIASGRPPFAMEKKLLEEITFDYFILCPAFSWFEAAANKNSTAARAYCPLCCAVFVFKAILLAQMSFLPLAVHLLLPWA